MELEPLTSICGQTKSLFTAGGKGTLCRMQKVTSDEHWPDEDSSAQEPRERRISAGFPLLNKLKTLTDKHQQQQQRYYAASSLHHQAAPPTTSTGVQPSDVAATKEHVEPEPLGSGLPLLQRLLLLKRKEDAERRNVAATAADLTSTGTTTTATTTSDTIAVSVACATLPSPNAATVIVDAPRKPKNCKKEVAFAEEVLVERSPPTVDEKIRGRGKGGLDVGREREPASPSGCLFESPLPGSCETLERRQLKSSLKRVSFGRRRATSMRGHFELLRRLMRAPTIEGYVARRSTFEKSVAHDTTLDSSPPSSVPSTTLFFSDYGGDDDDDDDILRSSSNLQRPLVSR